MRKTEHHIRGLLRSQTGSIGVAFAFGLSVLATAGGVAIDMSRWWNLRARAQSAVDTSTLSAIRELALPNVTDARSEEMAVRLTAASLGDMAASATISARRLDASTLKVDVAMRSPAMFGGVIGIAEMNIAVSATARLTAKQKLCMLVLNASNNNSLEASKESKITATECSVVVNSRDPKGLSVKDTARLNAQSICSSGGYEGGAGNFHPQPKTDCPPMRDPLSQRPPPTFGACAHNGRVVESGVVVLKPGVYCGGLKITKDAVAKLDPGIYVIKDGKLIVDSTATLEADGVGFYLVGNSSQFEFDKGTTISISAPASGEMSGILFYEDRGVSVGSKHMILSNNAHTLLGTIYLPRGTLFLDAEKPISNRAAYTIVIANQVQMISGPELVLNARYDSSTVPVPSGVGPINGTPSLIR